MQASKHQINTTESLSVAPESLSVAPESLSVTPESLSVTPESLSVATESLSVSRHALPTLTVAIVTFGPEGGHRIDAMQLPREEGVDYVVSWQEGEGLPIPEALASRDDIKIVTLPGLGVGRNRNNVVEHATGDIVLIGDDDIRYYPGVFDKIRRLFHDRPELEYASFQYDSDVPKSYPEGEHGLRRLPKNFYQTSFEIAFRRNSRAGRIRFPEDFGLEAKKYTAGEEDLFLTRARRQGIDCRLIPLKIAFHPGPTTGVKVPLADGAILTRGFLTQIEFPLTAIPRAVVNAWRIRRAGQASFFKALRLMLEGVMAGYFDRDVHRYLNSPL